MTKTEGMTMNRSWLVQRLEKPYKGSGNLSGFANPFSFGGGLKNGGLSDDAMTLIGDIFRFDYMGAAEFEFGAVPKALSEIADNTDQYVSGVISVPLKNVAISEWSRASYPKLEKGETTNVYVICRKDHVDEVRERILGWAAKPFGGLKEVTHLSKALRPLDERDGNICGWLELDNGFFFFTDEEMFKSTAELFGIEAGT